MKCPWMKETRKYDDYKATDEAGYPIQVKKTSFGDCVEDDCPFFYNGVSARFENGTRLNGRCTKALAEVRYNG